VRSLNTRTHNALHPADGAFPIPSHLYLHAHTRRNAHSLLLLLLLLLPSPSVTLRGPAASEGAPMSRFRPWMWLARCMPCSASRFPPTDRTAASQRMGLILPSCRLSASAQPPVHTFTCHLRSRMLDARPSTSSAVACAARLPWSPARPARPAPVRQRDPTWSDPTFCL